MANGFPPRIHCILARDARVGVVIRRGPTNDVCTLKWNLSNDTFEMGQWLRGRIYERRSDLSPDGEHFLYFAMNGHWDSKVRGSWTAISKAPFLKARLLLAKGDCWFGGGLFLSNRSYWINDGCFAHHEVVHNEVNLLRDHHWQPEHNFGGECLHVYYNRLMRNGWTMLPDTEKNERDGKVPCTIFDKAIGHKLVLRKLCYASIDHPKGCGVYYDTHVIVNEAGDIMESHPEWQWAELDRRRLVWAVSGKLCAGFVTKHGVKDVEVLRDFSDMKFESIKAPY